MITDVFLLVCYLYITKYRRYKAEMGKTNKASFLLQTIKTEIVLYVYYYFLLVEPHVKK